MNNTQNPTACLIIIGNEILSGRTKDKNLAYLGEALNNAGIRLLEGRVIPDIEATIIDTVNHCRERFTYVFTTGGIGPTHDDITTASVAKAFGVAVERHPEAVQRLRNHYKTDDINEARMKMADVPVGATLIDNPVSAAPGFVLGNVYVMAGVPRIMQAMVDFTLPQLQGGQPMLSTSIEVNRPEGDMAADIEKVQLQYPDVEIGVYPVIREGMLASNIVLRCVDNALLDEATQRMKQTLNL